MSAGVFPPTSSRSTRPRTSTRTPEFAGYADSMKERCSSGSAPAFLRRRRGRPDRIVGSPGGRGSSPGIGRVPYGRPDRPGANGAFCLSGTSRSPRARHPALSPSPPWLSPKPLLRPRPTLLSRSSASRSPSPPCFCPSPASERLLPRARPLCAVSSALLASSALRACALAGRKRAFACGVPGALRGTWVSPTRFDEDERPVSRERLDMRGTHSHEASSWARGYYAE